jgi:hypothetical protein
LFSSPFERIRRDALLKTVRKTEHGFDKFLVRGMVRAAPFALLLVYQ